MKGAAAFICVWAGLFVAPSSTKAAERLSLVIDPCVDADRAEARRLVDIELGSWDPASERVGSGVPAASVRCDDQGQVVIHVDDPLTNKSLERAVALARIAPKARTRALALSIVELLVASWTELEQPVVVPRSGLSSDLAAEGHVRAALSPVQSAPPRPRLVLSAVMALSPAQGDFGAAPAAGVRLTMDPARSWTSFVDVRVSQREAPATRGRIDWEAAAMMLGLGRRWDRGRLTLRGAGTLTAAAGRISGRPDDPAAVDGLRFAAVMAGAGADASASWRLAGPVWVEVGIDAGWTIVPVTARVDGRDEAKLGGPWFAGRLGLGVAL